MSEAVGVQSQTSGETTSSFNEPVSPLSRGFSSQASFTSVISWEFDADEMIDMDQDKESWLGKEGNRARSRHQIAVKATARKERWDKMKSSVGSALGLKWTSK
jgi:hypothetical protein